MHYKVFSTVFCILIAMTVQSRTMKVMGTITDEKGKPAPGVVVSDGFSVVETDYQGRYSFVRHDAAYYVYYSIPADCEVPMQYGIPAFYSKLDRDSVYNFRLKRMQKGIQKRFSLFFIGDPQCQNMYHLSRFHKETTRDIKNFCSSLSMPCYGITLGDIAYTEGEFNTNYILPLMKEEMKEQNIGMPVFQTVGNHDHIYNGLATNEQNPTAMYRFKRMFEDIFGPVNYSWNRGNVHIISMDNVMYDSLNKANKYHGEFTKEQLQWLKKDLASVSKDKLIILCAHIPVYRTRNCSHVLDILKEFQHKVFFSGHIHTNSCHIHRDGTKEYNLASASGCWWWSRICGDGSPNGYKVVTIDGSTIVNQIWKGTGCDKNFQIRLYRGNSAFGGKHERCQLPYGKNVILANVFAWDSDWKVKVYEDGVCQGEMKKIPFMGESDTIPSLTSCKDWWAIGYHTGVIGRGHIKGSRRRSYINTCNHLFIYNMKRANAHIKVVATDPYGNTYSQDQLIEGNAFLPGNKIYESAIPPAKTDVISF